MASTEPGGQRSPAKAVATGTGTAATPAGTGRSRIHAAVLQLLLAVLVSGAAAAQDLEPRQYSNIPVGMNFLVAGYVYSDGGVLFDPTVPLEDAEITINGTVLGYAHALGLGGMSAKVDVGLARVCLSGTAIWQGERASRDVCGFGDARARLSVNFLGAPAYRLGDFAGYRQDLVVGASIALSAPTGQYDGSRLVNIGTNRWSAKFEIGMSKLMNRWFLELALAGTFYQDNDNFLGGATRSQDPIVALQIHAVRNFSSGIWFALDGTYYRGGDTMTNGVANANLQRNARLGATLSMPINGRQSIKLYASSGVFTRTGTDFDTMGLAWQYRWGGGLGQ